ncbi:MAG: sigma-54-dependent Fis family transcriptional regulator, partial [Bdellovibrionales bacterium]|nr:sigma-54-dependent Fis family transcriptional regulator [Bdellovibrionales bacterium]
VIILTGFGSIQTAIEATKRGAFHFLTKPFNLDELYHLVEKAFENRSLKKENTLLKTQLHHKYKFDNIIGQSKEITRILELVDRVSDSDSTILVTGESGTGKEVIARAIHYNSARANKTLIPVNCGAIPNELLESELFGHVKGAFTGATNNRVGRFELANGGTIFLDEVGELPPPLQVKLLRAIQEKTFEPVGGTKTIEVDVRIIAATNVDLEKAVREGRFREDLFYRLNVIPMHIPALRERKSDIPLLVHHFIEKFNQTKKRELSGIDPNALEMMQGYDWPGNIRELENLVERISILKGIGNIEVSDIPVKYQTAVSEAIGEEEVHLPNTGIDFNSAVDAFENSLILKALERTNWNRNRAAQLLRLNRTTLVEKIKKKGLNPPPEINA